MSKAVVAAPVTGPELLTGCCHEAERAAIVALKLQGLRNDLHQKFHFHINAVITECHTTARRLRRLADQSQVHLSRLPTILNLLNIILPCLSRSLRDITEYYENKSISKEHRWRKLYHDVLKETPESTLEARFRLYNGFIQQLEHIVTNGGLYIDRPGLEIQKHRILHLRQLRNIEPPTPITEMVPYNAGAPWIDAKTHWAETIFKPRLKFKRLFKGDLPPSVVCGSLVPFGYINVPPDVKTLFMLNFNNGAISVTFYIRNSDRSPHLSIRALSRGTEPHFAMLAAHQLTITRVDECFLELRRWSRKDAVSKPWAVLGFATWEELVLFHCTFIRLKAYSPLSDKTHPSEFVVMDEEQSFTAQITDNGYRHLLAIRIDLATGGYRLHAYMHDSGVPQCPVWTAFLSDRQVKRPNIWIMRKPSNKVLLRGLHPYIFSPKYQPKYKNVRDVRAIEIQFQKEEAVKGFISMFETQDRDPMRSDIEDELDSGGESP